MQKSVSQAPGCLHRTIPSGSARYELGQALACALQQAAQQTQQMRQHASGWVVYLSGQLGVGKTRLCQGLLAGLGYQGHVKSPTYALVESYAVATYAPIRRVHHFDFYRISDPEELVGRVDVLKKLLKNKSAGNRKAAYFALGRTGDFSLVPEIMKGLRDSNVDVNVVALDALRYISRKPNGLGLSREPLAGAETASEERRVVVANEWRTKAYDTWMAWYRKVRPFDETDGLDELEALTGGR